MRIKEFKEALAIREKRISQLEGDLSIAHTNLDFERCAQIQVEELFDTQKLQIESGAVEQYKDSIEYKDEMRLGIT